MHLFTHATYLNKCQLHRNAAIGKIHQWRYFSVHIYVKFNPQLTRFCRQTQSGSI